MSKGMRAVAVGLVVAAGAVGVTAAVRKSSGAPAGVVAGQAAPQTPGWSKVGDVAVSTTDLWFAGSVGRDDIVLVGGPVFSVEDPISYVTELTLVSLASGRATKLDPPPLDHPLAHATGLVHNGNVFMTGRSCERYDERLSQCLPGHYEMWSGDLRGSWRRHDLPVPDEGDLGTAGFTLVASPAEGRLLAHLTEPDRLWSYDIAGRVWEALPPPPVPARKACTGDGRTVLLDYADVRSGPGSIDADERPGSPRVASYDHARGQWKQLPSPPLPSAMVMHLTCAGRNVLVTGQVDGAVEVASWDDAAAAWASSKAPVEPPFVIEDRTLAWNGSELVLWDPYSSAGAAFDPGGRTWRRVPGGPPSLASVVAPSGELVVIGSRHEDRRRPTVYRYRSSPGAPEDERPLPDTVQR